VKRSLVLIFLAVLLAACSTPGTVTSAPPPDTPTPTRPVDVPASQEPAPPEPEVTTSSEVPPTPIPPEEPAQAEEIRFQSWELVTALAWSTDGELLAAAAGNQIYVIEPDTLEPLAQLPVGALSPSLSFHPQDRLLAAAARDGRVRIWNLSSPEKAGEPDVTLDAHKKGANVVAFSHAGDQLATGGNDAVVRIWDLQTRERLAEIIGGTFSVPDLVYQPDGNILGIINGALLRWREPVSGRMLGAYQSPTGEDVPFYSAALSPDGSTLAMGDHQNRIWIWDLTVGLGDKPEKTPQPQIWQIPAKTTGSAALVWDLAFSPSGELLASSSGDGKVRLWDARQGELLEEISAHSLAATSLAFRPDGAVLASGGLDGAVRLWQIDPEGR